MVRIQESKVLVFSLITFSNSFEYLQVKAIVVQDKPRYKIGRTLFIVYVSPFKNKLDRLINIKKLH
jgi:hypothetical protein